MNTEPGKQIGTKLSFHMNRTSVCGIMITTFVLDGMPVNVSFLSVIIERHSSLTSRYVVWNGISYHGRSNLLRIEGNLNINRYFREMLEP